MLNENYCWHVQTNQQIARKVTSNYKEIANFCGDRMGFTLLKSKSLRECQFIGWYSLFTHTECTRSKRATTLYRAFNWCFSIRLKAYSKKNYNHRQNSKELVVYWRWWRSVGCSSSSREFKTKFQQVNLISKYFQLLGCIGLILPEKKEYPSEQQLYVFGLNKLLIFENLKIWRKSHGKNQRINKERRWWRPISAILFTSKQPFIFIWE